MEDMFCVACNQTVVSELSEGKRYCPICGRSAEAAAAAVQAKNYISSRNKRKIISISGGSIFVAAVFAAMASVGGLEYAAGPILSAFGTLIGIAFFYGLFWLGRKIFNIVRDEPK